MSLLAPSIALYDHEVLALREGRQRRLTRLCQGLMLHGTPPEQLRPVEPWRWRASIYGGRHSVEVTPHWRPGDRVACLEAVVRLDAPGRDGLGPVRPAGGWLYRVDWDRQQLPAGRLPYWIRAEDMPRERVRLWLRIESARLERVAAIDDAGAAAEGAVPSGAGRWAVPGPWPAGETAVSAREAFGRLWVARHSHWSWYASQWVEVYEVTAEQRSGDAGAAVGEEVTPGFLPRTKEGVTASAAGVEREQQAGARAPSGRGGRDHG